METKPKKLLTAKMGNAPKDKKKNKQLTPEEARAAKEAKKQAANNEAARRAALRNDYAISQGEEGKRGGPTTKEEYERRQAAEANRGKNADSHRTKSSGNIYSGVTKKSEANDAIAESREKERKSKQLALSNPEKAQSEKAAAEKQRIAELRKRLGETESGKERLKTVDTHKTERNGHRILGAFKRVGSGVKGFFQGFKNRMATDSVGYEFDMMKHIYSEACENFNEYMEIMSMTDEEFDVLLESMDLDDLERIEYIFAVETVADAMDAVSEAINENDSESEDFVIEACAVFSEYGLDDLFCAVTECAN